MWDFFETIRHRHSVRKYQHERPVEPERLHAILEAAVSAPSAGDLQSYRILVITDADTRMALQGAANDQPFVGQAPVCLVFCSEPALAEREFGERGRELYAVQDATIAAAYAQLAVVAAGMGSTWVGYFDEAAVTKVLDLEAGLKPIAMLSLGYPAELPEPTARRHLDEVVSYR